jgi:hypothetical protein
MEWNGMEEIDEWDLIRILKRFQRNDRKTNKCK